MKMRKVVLDENIIPPITHPWGRVWIQPNPKDIILDDEYAAMKQKDFDLLADYTASEPTGKWIGRNVLRSSHVSGRAKYGLFST